MRKNVTGIFALLLVTGVYLYRNRAVIERYMESFGINLPEALREQSSRILQG